MEKAGTVECYISVTDDASSSPSFLVYMCTSRAYMLK